jgi:transmembrane sensor
MKPSRSPIPASAEDQAALWAAKLDGSSLSSADRAALDTWLAGDPQHRVLLSEYCQFSADLEQQLPALVATGMVAVPSGRSVRHRFRTVALVAGSLAAAAAIAVGVWVHSPTPQTETVATSVAQRRTLKLADGSVIELNARTSLLVEFRAKERHVRMADGEAFFTVAKDKSRPFIVETPAGSVRVTGTVFDVHADTPADLAVTVVQGSVQVSPGQAAGPARAPVSLGANDQLVVDAAGPNKRHLSDGDVEDALAWREGYVVFDGTPLAKALAKFARYHGRAIHAAPEVAGLHVGGRYSLDDLDAFLAAIEAALPVRVSRESSGEISVLPRAGSKS